MATDPQTVYNVPKGPVALYSALWVVPLAILLFITTWTDYSFEYHTYQRARLIVLLVMLALALAGLVRAFEMFGVKSTDPWYTSGFLVALVLFWGLFPPTWFFTEYLMFDNGSIQLPPDTDKVKFLAALKTYADLGSKVWVAVGAALATTIGFAKK
jgi:hypothetical protein